MPSTLLKDHFLLSLVMENERDINEAIYEDENCGQ